jgi:hypothetical protein
MPKPNEFLYDKEVLYPSDESLPQKKNSVAYFDFEESPIMRDDKEIIMCVTHFLNFLGLNVKETL